MKAGLGVADCVGVGWGVGGFEATMGLEGAVDCSADLFNPSHLESREETGFWAIVSICSASSGAKLTIDVLSVVSRSLSMFSSFALSH